MTPPLTWLEVLVGLLRPRRKWVELPLGYGHRTVSAMLREVEGKTCSGCDEVKLWVRHGQRGFLTVEHNGPCEDEGRKYVHWPPDHERERKAMLYQVLMTAGRR